jgi:hypothetical protein
MKRNSSVRTIIALLILICATACAQSSKPTAGPKPGKAKPAAAPATSTVPTPSASAVADAAKAAAPSTAASKECPPCEPSEAQKLKLELVKAKQQVILNEIIWRSRQAQIPELEQQAKALQIELAGAADAARKANGWPDGTTFDLQCFLGAAATGRGAGGGARLLLGAGEAGRKEEVVAPNDHSGEVTECGQGCARAAAAAS